MSESVPPPPAKKEGPAASKTVAPPPPPGFESVKAGAHLDEVAEVAERLAKGEVIVGTKTETVDRPDATLGKSGGGKRLDWADEVRSSALCCMCSFRFFSFPEREEEEANDVPVLRRADRRRLEGSDRARSFSFVRCRYRYQLNAHTFTHTHTDGGGSDREGCGPEFEVRVGENVRRARFVARAAQRLVFGDEIRETVKDTSRDVTDDINAATQEFNSASAQREWKDDVFYAGDIVASGRERWEYARVDDLPDARVGDSKRWRDAKDGEIH